uniref:Capsid protein n=1 Tax=Torque teno virus TaxID=68887 RepID=A0A1B1FDJ6_9VIRU|nr:ORF1 [Torque teno virus]
MAWSWWWQRRRRWRRPIRRRRWRRLRGRRPGRPLRRRRRRPRTVRRRRWGRRRGRRRRPRRARRRRRGRRFKKRLILTQWHPSVVRRCFIKGIVPMMVCGHTRWNYNYALHSEDYPEQGRYPFGGSLTTTTWSLKVLFDEHQKHHNTWGYPNTQLDLARYRGARFTFYRDKKTDFIVFWNRKPPFKLNKYSCAMLHPGMLMQSKHRVLIPSFDTKPRGKMKVRIRIRPPTLLEDKWYTQQDLCEVNLAQLSVTAADFRHPWIAPDSNTLVTTFQVLKEFYYNTIGVGTLPTNSYTAISGKDKGKNKEYKEHLQTVWNTLVNENSYWNSFPVLEIFSSTVGGIDNSDIKTHMQKLKSTDTSPGENNNFHTGRSTRFGFNTYNPKAKQADIENLRDAYWNLLQKDNDIAGTYGKPKGNEAKYFNYQLGIYSPIFLTPKRSNINFPTAYQDVTYNPNCDRGVLNRVWFQYGTKPTTEFDDKQCKCVIENLPLWALLYCYHDYVAEEMNIDTEIYSVGLVVVQCPYTFPPMYDKNRPNMGYVFYDALFGEGKMPDGRGQVPPYWQMRWYPRMAFQKQVMHDITITGPFSYKDGLVSTQLTATYKFDFMWGGNMISEQIIRNPCTQPGVAPTYPDRQRRDLQVVDPRTMGPQFVFHTWDWRRGVFGKGAIDRVSQKPGDDGSFTIPYKKPRFFPPTDRLQGRESASGSQEERQDISSEETDQEAPQAEIPQLQPQQQFQLEVQLLQQQQLGKKLRILLQEMFKTQANLHINPYLSIQQ